MCAVVDNTVSTQIAAKDHITPQTDNLEEKEEENKNLNSSNHLEPHEAL